ncbi:NAD-dependent epimerase/dehydratase family protein [Streptomyces sp. NPDC055952]|uniref:NAD-dependent epimerase/dehydratase family protein n=1 Tax=Streptomyces sp. NPDC055952 TaxID=3345663 RepID=UPI0035D9F1C7
MSVLKSGTASATGAPALMRRGAGTVLVAGGNGFVGSAVVEELLTRESAGGAPAVRVLSRRPPRSSHRHRVSHVPADLAQPGALRGLCQGVVSVVHTATYVGRDAALCETVNHHGTLALLEEARRAGVEHFVYVSTASVYGAGPHRGADEYALTPNPASPASSSRLKAEQAVLASGGTVLRPHLVHGVGDVWFIPTIVRLLTLVAAWPSGATSHSSVIAVRDLARCVASLVTAPESADRARVYHAAHPRPVSMEQVLLALHHRLGLPLPRRVSLPEHRARLARAATHLSDHQYTLLTQDHWYDSDALWARIGEVPELGFEARLAEAARWYTAHLARCAYQ